MSFILFTDAHVCMQAWRDMPGVRGDAYQSLSQVIRYAVDHKVEAVVDGGDLFDAQPTAYDAHFMLSAVEELKRAGIKVYSIQGQHARDRIISWACIDPYVTNLEAAGPVTLADGKIVMQGFDHSPAEELKAKLESGLKPETNVLVLHQKATGVTPGMGADFDPEWVDCHVRLVLMGDYHKAINWSRPCPPPLPPMQLMYNGSLCMQAIDECPEKFFTVVYDDLSYERVKLTTRPFMASMVQSQEQLDKLLEQLKSFPAEGMLVVKFDTRIKDVEDLLRKRRPDINIKARPLPIVVADTPVPLPGSISLESCLRVLADPAKDAELYSFAKQLIDSRDVRGTLQEWRGKFLQDV
jgi:DNA repair exonuclease SbcCD nuclease subunit